MVLEQKKLAHTLAIEVPRVAKINAADAKKHPALAGEDISWSSIAFNRSYGYTYLVKDRLVRTCTHVPIRRIPLAVHRRSHHDPTRRPQGLSDGEREQLSLGLCATTACISCYVWHSDEERGAEGS